MAPAEAAFVKEVPKGPGVMVSKLKIENFKCIKSLEVELAPLTIFIGPNGSGKSSILEALALMAQAATTKTSLITARTGELVSFKDKDALFRDRRTSDWLCLGLSIRPSEEERIAIKEAFEKDAEATGTFLNTPIAKEIIEGRIEEICYVNGISQRGFLHAIYVNGEKLIMYKREEECRPECYPANLHTPGDLFLSEEFLINRHILYFAREIASIIRKRIANKRVKFISAERGAISWYLEARACDNYVGRKGEHVLEILARLMKPVNEEKFLPYELLSKEFGVDRIWVGWDHDNILTSDYKDPWTGTAGLKLPLIGYGSRQLISVIAQLAISEPGDIIMVEEPEISLHPAYQAKLPILFGRAVMEGKQVLVTTHSSYFPLSLPILFDGYILKGETKGGYKEYMVRLKPKDIAIYHVTRGSDGYTQIKRLEIDENGLKEGIPSFIEVEKTILGRYLGGG